MRGRGYFLRKQLAACRAAKQQDYRDAKVRVAQTIVLEEWQNRGGIIFKSITVLISSQSGNTAVSLRLTLPYF